MHVAFILFYSQYPKVTLDLVNLSPVQVDAYKSAKLFQRLIFPFIRLDSKTLFKKTNNTFEFEVNV